MDLTHGNYDAEIRSGLKSAGTSQHAVMGAYERNKMTRKKASTMKYKP